jgi:hypothetical protein
VAPPAAFDAASGCLSFTALATGTSPTVGELEGTPFAVAVAATGLSGGSAPVPLPVVSGISPSSGPAAGGTRVTITGTNFTAPATVSFGPVAATDVLVLSPTSIEATSPAGSGTVDVTVTTGAGTSAAGPADRFTYQVPSGQSPPTAAFTDVPASYWAYAAVAALTARGIVGGFPDGTFRPDAPVTRAQFVKMLVLATGLTPTGGALPFADVPAGAWYAPYVAAAVRAGIVQGLTPETFGPDLPVTREQLALLLARALRLQGSAALTFRDAAAIDAWAAPGVQAAVAAGLLDGFPDGTFRPLAAATRAQAAKVLALVVNRQAPSGGS